MEDIAPDRVVRLGEIPGLGDAIISAEQFGVLVTNDLPELLGLPEVGHSLGTFGIRVLRRIETAGRISHFPLEIVKGLMHDAGVFG